MMMMKWPADRLRKLAAELVQLADAFDRAAPMPAPGRDRYFLDTRKAMAISRRSSSWLYATAPKYRFGWRLPSGSWAFSEPRLRAFLAGRASACEENEICEKSDGAPLSVSPKSWHGEKSA
jgi:hypothetical protein